MKLKFKNLLKRREEKNREKLLKDFSEGRVLKINGEKNVEFQERK